MGLNTIKNISFDGHVHNGYITETRLTTELSDIYDRITKLEDGKLIHHSQGFDYRTIETKSITATKFNSKYKGDLLYEIYNKQIVCVQSTSTLRAYVYRTNSRMCDLIVETKYVYPTGHILCYWDKSNADPYNELQSVFTVNSTSIIFTDPYDYDYQDYRDDWSGSLDFKIYLV